MSKKVPTVIRLSVTDDVRRALNTAKQRYPTLSDPEILKLGLSNIVTGGGSTLISTKEKDEISRSASYAVGQDYLKDSEEDLYTSNSGKTSALLVDVPKLFGAPEQNNWTLDGKNVAFQGQVANTEFVGDTLYVYRWAN